MNERDSYNKWIGVLLGFLLSGSAHFLSGSRRTGLKWFLGLAVSPLLVLTIFCLPGLSFYGIGIALWLVLFAFWIVMLRQSYRPVPRIGWLGWGLVLVIACGLRYALPLGLKTLVGAYKLPTNSMSPTVQKGDCILVEKITYQWGNPERGDIVAFSAQGIGLLPQNEVYLKRVVGLPGDTIRIDPPYLIVNGKALLSPPIFKKIAGGEPPFFGFKSGVRSSYLTKPTDQIVLKDDQYFVLGDNIDHSVDSRYWGPVPRQNILGKATRIYWPYNRVDQSLGSE
ncbi:MAG: signal peptidase I [Verrucomicrobia bacterium Tous-C9LFEB]|nr:MAG: signal peptidase I [Verrucomicrobia bacterium Tous-C9LFEB]